LFATPWRGNLRDLQATELRPKHSGFKAHEPGYIHIDVKYLPEMNDESSRRYLFWAIDRATRLGSLSAFATARRPQTPGVSFEIWSGPAHRGSAPI